MPTTPETILQRASEHATLIQRYIALERTPLEVNQIFDQISALELVINAEEKKLHEFESKTSKERAHFVGLRKSTLRRLAYTMTGRGPSFEDKVCQEEEKYIQSWNEECRSKMHLEDFQKRLAEAYATRTRLQDQLEIFQRIQNHLDAFYDSIFVGPTPEFPEEDNEEDEVSIAFAALVDHQSRVKTEERALEQLENASRKLDYALKQAKKSLHFSRDSIDHGRLTAAHRQETALDKARTAMDEASTLVRRAGRIQHQVDLLDTENLFMSRKDEDEMGSDDEYHLGDCTLHRATKIIKANVEAAQAHVATQISAERLRLKAAKQRAEQAEKDWKMARGVLRDIRRRIVERTLEMGGSAPPPYEPIIS